MMKLVNARAATDALLSMESETIREIREDPARARDKALMCAGAAVVLAEIGVIEPELAGIATDRFREKFEAAWAAAKGGAA